MGNRKDGLRCLFEQNLTCTVVLKHRWERNEIFTCLQKVALLESTQDSVAEMPLKGRSGNLPSLSFRRKGHPSPLVQPSDCAPHLRKLGRSVSRRRRCGGSNSFLLSARSRNHGATDRHDPVSRCARAPLLSWWKFALHVVWDPHKWENPYEKPAQCNVHYNRNKFVQTFELSLPCAPKAAWPCSCLMERQGQLLGAWIFPINGPRL